MRTDPRSPLARPGRQRTAADAPFAKKKPPAWTEGEIGKPAVAGSPRSGRAYWRGALLQMYSLVSGLREMKPYFSR